jgi:hypothetical protein
VKYGVVNFSNGCTPGSNPKNRLRDGPVERVKNLSLAEFRSRYQKPGIPMVLEGAALASHSKTYYTR